MHHAEILTTELRTRFQERRSYLRLLTRQKKKDREEIDVTGGISYLKRYRKYTPFRANVVRSRNALYKPTFWKVAEMIANGEKGAGAGLSNLMARLIGGREWTRSEDERKCWAGRWNFTQFKDSPHVRISRTVFYHGVWEKHGALGDFPHGEGLAEFLEGFGVAMEEKVLNVAVIQARRLKAMDLFTSDPYVKMEGNHKVFKTTIKKKTLTPYWEEGFELDITDPNGVVCFSVFDYDLLSKDDFMGGIDIALEDLADGKPHRKWYKLVDNRRTKKGKIIAGGGGPGDRGELELQLHWTERDHEEDVDLKRMKATASVQVQSWARMVLSKGIMVSRRRQQLDDEEHVDLLVNSIQCAYRQRLAYRELRRRRRWRKNAIRIQSAARRWLAIRLVARIRLEYAMSTKIQSVVRRRLAKVLLLQLKVELRVVRLYAAIVLQGFTRQYQARCAVIARRGVMKDIGKYVPELLWDDDWFETYGRDKVFPSKRLRRIVYRYFYKVDTNLHPFLGNL